MYTSCRSLPTLSSSTYYPSRFIMVTKCPTSWSRSDVRSYCQDDSDANLIRLLPVETSSGVIFKNSFCAFCHNVDLKGLTVWKLVTEKPEGNVSNLFEVQTSRSPWSVRPGLICDHDHDIFVTSCTDGTTGNLSLACRMYLDPKLQLTIQHDIHHFKTEYCATCTVVNDTLLMTRENPILSVATVVVFGAGSFSNFEASCDDQENYPDDRDSIFQNACRLYDTVIIEETARLERRNDCLSKFMNDTFHNVNQDSIQQIIRSEGNEPLIVELILPTGLAFHLLNTSIKTGRIKSHCNANFEVYLSSNIPNGSSCKSSVICNQTCEINSQYTVPKTCSQAFHRLLNCSYAEKTVPFLNFIVDEIYPEKLVFTETNAMLNSSQFTFTEDGNVLTCLEYLYGRFLNIIRLVHIVGSSLSLIGVLAIICLHYVFPKLQTLYGVCLVNLCVCIVITLVLLYVNLITDHYEVIPEMIVLLSHYTMLAIFSWQLVIAIHVARSLGRNAIANRMSRISSRSTALKYCLAGWLTPVPFIAVGVILHTCQSTPFSYQRYWMSEGVHTIIIFFIPINVLTVMSAIFFFITMRNIQIREDHSASRHHQGIENFSVALRVS